MGLQGRIMYANLGKRTAKIREGVDPANAYTVYEAVKCKERARRSSPDHRDRMTSLSIQARRSMVRAWSACPNGTVEPASVLRAAQGR